MDWVEVLSDSKIFEINQKFEALENLIGFETENSQTIKIKQFEEEGSKVVYYAKEKSDCITRNFCNPRMRALNISIKDDSGDVVLKLMKGCNLNCLDCCCLPEMRMQDQLNDKDLGFVSMNCHLCPQIDISVRDNDNDERFTIKSNCCPFGLICRDTLGGLCFNEVELFIYDTSGRLVGKIQKTTRGLCGINSGNLSFKCKLSDENITSREKALLLGACFLVDFSYFEDNGFCKRCFGKDDAGQYELVND